MSLERQILLFFTEIVRQLLMPREQKPSSVELWLVVFSQLCTKPPSFHHSAPVSLHCGKFLSLVGGGNSVLHLPRAL